METQKAENLLNLAYDSTEAERMRSPSLNAAVTGDGRWEILVKSFGSLSFLEEWNAELEVVSLYGNYTILTLPKERIPDILKLDAITFAEMPKNLYLSLSSAKEASCISPVMQPPDSLSGNGILIGVVDSGIALEHPDFRRADGSSRVLYLWDQTREGNPPEGYRIGTEYDNSQINEALVEKRPLAGDSSGHGTAVAGIAAGNGRQNSQYRGVAPEASLIIVKMRAPQPNSFPRTTELMQGVNYCIEKAISLSMPISINLSFGNNYGSHNGTSLLETYLDQISTLGQSCIVCGSGNEGYGAIHSSLSLNPLEEAIVEFSIGAREQGLSLQLWKQYVDEFQMFLVHPSGQLYGPISPNLSPGRFLLGTTEVMIYYGEPAPYHLDQEIYFSFLPRYQALDTGIWSLRLLPMSIKNGRIHLWMPSRSILNQDTRFLAPDPLDTLTIPSTARSVITVGAYDSRRGSFADFSGRGGRNKPDLVAPGIDITAPAAPDTYAQVTGTSFAAPFVTGSSALLMEWGIKKGNDPYLYGEKIKAFLMRSARPLSGYLPVPNPQTGYGALCLADSIR